MKSLVILITCLVLMGWMGNPKESSTVYLPVVSGGVSQLKIYDKYGAEQDWNWLVENFGPIIVEAGSVVELREVEGPATLVADVGAAGVPVVFFWPDAPFLPPELQNCGKVRGLVVYSKSNGRAEFAMGGGSYYWPPDIGPHWVWMQDSKCAGGFGMIGETDHRHLDSIW